MLKKALIRWLVLQSRSAVLHGRNIKFLWRSLAIRRLRNGTRHLTLCNFLATPRSTTLRSVWWTNRGILENLRPNFYHFQNKPTLRSLTFSTCFTNNTRIKTVFSSSAFTLGGTKLPFDRITDTFIPWMKYLPLHLTTSASLLLQAAILFYTGVSNSSNDRMQRGQRYWSGRYVAGRDVSWNPKSEVPFFSRPHKPGSSRKRSDWLRPQRGQTSKMMRVCSTKSRVISKTWLGQSTWRFRVLPRCSPVFYTTVKRMRMISIGREG